MKKFTSSFKTLLILVIINFLASNFFKLQFLELSFIVGLLACIIVAFFTSEGGFTTRILDSKVRHFEANDNRHNSYFTKFHMNTPLKVSILYTLVAIIASVVVYWKYF